MTANSTNYINIAAEFYGCFNGRHVVLFLGKSIDNDSIKECIAHLPWSCIITSRIDDAVGSYFNNDERKVIEYNSRSKLPARLLSKQDSLPLLRLYGQDEPIDADELAMRGVTEKEYLNAQARKMMGVIPELFRLSNVVLMVIGYDPDDDDLPYSIFADIILNDSIHDSKVQIWGGDANKPKSKLFYKLASSRGFIWHEEKLQEVVKVWNESEETQGTGQTVDSVTEGLELFYKGEKPVSLPTERLVRYKHFIRLLTEQIVYENRPFGKLLQARWYYNFLMLSSTEGPQWYGYLKNSDFHLKRDFEDILVSLVRKKLVNDSPKENDDYSPVILYGDPSSSKSITLGALAYRVFNEHISPVIFINNDTMLFSSDSEELEELDRLMEMVEKEGPSTRILVIWDSSSYRNITSNALVVARYLKNRGRRFVLVCSAYDTVNEKKDTADYYRVERAGSAVSFFPSSQDESDLYYINGCFFVHASREMSEAEKGRFWQKLFEYSGMSSEQKGFAREQTRNDNDIFDYFYKIMGILRPQLELSLTREERKVTKYVNDELKLLGNVEIEEKRKAGSIAQAFIAAGIDISDLNLDFDYAEEEEKEEKTYYDLHQFNCCIAMFSRFKIEVSLSLAMQMLKSREVLLEDFSNNFDMELIKLVTTQIPWLRYGDSADGCDYSFRFRNTKEAELFLQRNQVSGEKQVDLLCDIMELYGTYYEKYQQPFDPSMGRNLQDLIRLMGPNSQYAPFKLANGDLYGEHKEILRSMERIINMLDKLCCDYMVPDVDAGFATLLVTFTREYYGIKWRSLYYEDQDVDAYTPEMYQHRIRKLDQIIGFAINTIEELRKTIGNSSGREKRHLIGQSNGLTVELALCNAALLKLNREYTNRFKEAGSMLSIHGLSYDEIYDRLSKVILSDPSNGHAYNALFKSFEEIYENGKLSEGKKIKYLTEVQLIADDCDSIDSQSRGADERDEISVHLLKLRGYCSQYEVSIEDIHSGNVAQEFFELYNNLIEVQGSPAAITFVCQQELKKANINYLTDGLNDYQQSVCEKIKNYMLEERNVQCVEKNYYALLLLLRVTWMAYTRKPMRDKPECQMIVLPTQQWNEIRQISEACILSSKRTINGIKPIVGLIYGLATLQAKGDYRECDSIIASISEYQFISDRMKVPFIVCDEKGPQKYTGLVKKIEDNRRGRIKIGDMPPTLPTSADGTVFFHINNFGIGAKMPVEGQRLNDLELGLGYRGFSVYTEEGRRKKAGQK